MNDHKAIADTAGQRSPQPLGSAEPPLCTDCKWMTRDSDDGTPLCKRPGQGRRNVVNGGMIYKLCADQREDNDWMMNLLFGKSCGINAKYFQPNTRITDRH
jgi:hypothetical protein